MFECIFLLFFKLKSIISHFPLMFLFNRGGGGEGIFGTWWYVIYSLDSGTTKIGYIQMGQQRLQI